MEAHEEAMVKSLVAVAWADGRVDDNETEVIDALISAFGLEGDDAASVREYAKTERSIEDVPLTELSRSDRHVLLQHAVVLTWVDGEQTDKEVAVLDTLTQRLNLEDEEASAIRAAANDRAKRLLELL